uniref:Uncharacterized protein n=1 Tax=Tanacetum cinerariifolium TaxID=118510 RepID=A0A6L2MVQ9_TANCI|nr:hypothetical protein [Tanacetum cinerariifolium]GEV06743.1 hypothetical protein [Tanacetum cinerariifolium]
MVRGLLKQMMEISPGIFDGFVVFLGESKDLVSNERCALWGNNLFINWETNCSHVVTRLGGSLLNHSFALPFRVKWKNWNLDASFVAPSACMLSTMLMKSLKCWKGFSLFKPWNSQTLWINQTSREFMMFPVCSSSRTIEFWNLNGFRPECLYKPLEVGVVLVLY